jgi:FkbM family methyltransferase
VTIADRLSAGWVDPAGVTGGTPLHRIARRLLPLDTRWSLAEKSFQARTQFRLANDLARELGWGAVAKIRYAQVAKPLTASRRLSRLRIPGYPHPLSYREGTSDALVIEQVFARREYECVAGESAVRTIVDLGANVGYTAFYLLHRYPAARIAVVEPDEGNLAVCRKNLSPFGDRVTFIHAGIWSQPGPMTLDRTGEEWAYTVRPARPGERVGFEAITIGQVLARAGFDQVDILKVDIEGAEEVAFTGKSDWLDRVGTLVIELHGPACEDAVESAIGGRPLDRTKSGELTIYRLGRNGVRP